MENYNRTNQFMQADHQVTKIVFEEVLFQIVAATISERLSKCQSDSSSSGFSVTEKKMSNCSSSFYSQKTEKLILFSSYRLLIAAGFSHITRDGYDAQEDVRTLKLYCSANVTEQNPLLLGQSIAVILAIEKK